MTRKIIDMTKDPRGGQFEYFRTMTDPWAGITVPVDITDLLASLNGRPFFLSYLYAVMCPSCGGDCCPTVRSLSMITVTRRTP
jgi:chloramphenicol O-acetyltransferase